MTNPIPLDEILSDRYHIIRELGHGGFGRTYLAEDTNRFNESCVLKEFAPQIQGTYALEKAEELFSREAGVLYSLQHPQIPNFRELFRIQYDGEGRLFLVQDHVEGQTYRMILKNRLKQGQAFSEAEIGELFQQILPVLDYIHSMGVIHRDIAPDNLMLRSYDGLPVLIDFGGVKQVAATIESQFILPEGESSNGVGTRLGKVGYAPPEQMQQGIVSPSSDLYALAATALVLLTGKEPQQLISPLNSTWEWQQEVTLSPKFANILERMLAKNPRDRFSSANNLLMALENITPPSPPLSVEATVRVATPPVEASVDPVEEEEQLVIPPASGINPWLGWVAKIALFLAGVGVAGVLGWIGGNLWLQNQLNEANNTPPPEVSFPPVDDPEPEPPSRFSLEERQKRQALRERRLELGIDYRFYINLVNEAFWEQYPEQRGQVLTDNSEDAELRKQWNEVATEWLEKLEFLSPSARRDLGDYDAATRELWKQQVNRFRLSSRSLYDLVDAEFFYRFPEQEGEDFIEEPIGQVWQGIVVDKLQAMREGDALERITFSERETEEVVTGTLAPGEGQAYTADLSADQIAEVELETTGDALFSFYSPTGSYRFIEDAANERNWSGILPETGFYEFTIVSTSNSPIRYRMRLSVENPQSEEDRREVQSIVEEERL